MCSSKSSNGTGNAHDVTLNELRLVSRDSTSMLATDEGRGEATLSPLRMNLDEETVQGILVEDEDCDAHEADCKLVACLIEAALLKSMPPPRCLRRPGPDLSGMKRGKRQDVGVDGIVRARLDGMLGGLRCTPDSRHPRHQS